MSQEPIKVSVIIPAFNAGEYLSKCFSSLDRQKCNFFFEVICINDGSTDNTEEIATNFDWKKVNFIYIKQTNQGPSVARNKGIEVAKGDYIFFLDADDHIRDDALSFLVDKFEKYDVDLISFSGFNMSPEGELLDNPYWNFQYIKGDVEKVYSKEEIHNWLDSMAVSTCLTCYRKEFLVKNEILFPEGTLYEDNYFFIKAALRAKKVYLTREKIYFRQIHPKSITQNPIKNAHYSAITYGKVIDLIRNDAPEAVLDRFKEKYSRHVSGSIQNTPLIIIFQHFSSYYSFFSKIESRKKLLKELTKKILSAKKISEADRSLLLIKGKVVLEKRKNVFSNSWKLLGYPVYTKKLPDIDSNEIIFQLSQNIQQGLLTLDEKLNRLEENFNQIELKLKRLESELHSEKDSLKRISSNVIRAEGEIQEALWASTLSIATTQNDWFKKLDLRPGRWALGFGALYALVQILELVKPLKILELGLGQSTKVISEYCKSTTGTEHIVVESDETWIEFFLKQLELGKNSTIMSCGISEIFFKEKEIVPVFEGLKDKIKGKKFDLIIVDAPIGGRQKVFSRVDILSLIPDGISDTFVIFFDDSNRRQEINTIKEVEMILQNNKIDYGVGTFHSQKNSTIIVSSNLRFLLTI